MRVQYTKEMSALLVALMFIVTMSFVPHVYLNTNSENESDLILSPMDNEEILLDDVQQILVDDNAISESGSISYSVLNPVLIEQTGYSVSGSRNARTDTMENTGYDLPIDTDHNWLANEANVTITDLTRLYAVNGTFDNGIPGENLIPNGNVINYPYGWDSSSSTTDLSTTQRSTYEQLGSYYVGVENEGKSIGTGSNLRFQHALGTEVLWNQSIDNSPYAEEFIFSVDYFYVRGPLDIALGATIALEARLDGVVFWSISLPSLAARDTWYSSGDIIMSVPGAADILSFELGLSINATHSLNPAVYGYIHSNYITTHLDNVVLKSSSAPDFDSVDLTFNAESQSTPITGALGIGSVIIQNSTYWNSPFVATSVTSNTSVSFTYEARLFSHRFTNSTYAPDPTKIGVTSSTVLNSSSMLTFYSYIGYFGDYEDPGLIIQHPYDWENATVYDSLLAPVTGLCTINVSSIEVPSSILDQLGWWQFTLESPNYAKSIKSQIFDSDWYDEEIFRISNSTRASVEIGTLLEVLDSLIDVNVTWFNPSDAVWYSELISGGVAGQVTSTSQVLNSGSSPAGVWWIEVYWNNGTEIAYGHAQFEVHHTANLVADPDTIEIDAGHVITGIVLFSDGDTGAYITDDLTTISGNWSLSTVYFTANPVKNWWEVSLDTGDIGAGNFIVHVDASRPYYDPASCEIHIISTNVTRLNSPNAPWSSTQWGSEISLTFNFEVYDSGTDTWGPVTNNSNLSVNINWTTGYWNVIEDVTPGIYLISLDTSAHPSGTYLLETIFEKPDHESKQLFLTLIVSPIASSLAVMGDTSARVNISDDYHLKLKFSDQAAIPIPSASVVVDSVSPVAGLSYTSVDEVSGESGNYSVTLTPTVAGVYTVRFVATETNSEPGSTVFVLVVNDVATSLIVPGGNSFEIGLTDVFNTTFTFETFDFIGVESASISILYSGTPGGISWDLIEIGLGEYSVEFSASLSGTYVVTIAAFKQYYQSASDSFFLVVRDISTNFTVLNGTAGIVSYGKDYNMVLSYTNGSAFGLEGADITIESVVPATGLSWGSVIPGYPGFYSLLLTPETSNTFTILVRASLLNHQVQFVRFTITATAIASSLTVLNSSTTISFDQSYTVYVYYQSEDFVGLVNASVSIQNPPAEVEYSEFEGLGGGFYRVILNPQEIGIFDLVFRAELIGYQSDTAGFALGASRIQTDLRIASGLSSGTIQYLQTSELSVIYERTDFNQTVNSADISIQMSPSTGLEWSFHEDSGAYHIEVEPAHIGRWTLTISASKLGYSLGSVQFILDVEPVRIVAQLLSTLSAVEGREFPIEISLTHEGNSTTPVIDALVEFRITASGSPAGNFQSLEDTDTPGVYRTLFTFPLYHDNLEFKLEIRVTIDNYELVGGFFTATYIKSIDPVLRYTPIIAGSGFIFAILFGLVIGLRVNNTRKKRKNLDALQIKNRFDDVSNILGIIALHKKSGLPVYSKMIKGGFEEVMVSAFITAITHFRSEFEMDEKHWEFNVIPISDIISTVPTKSLIVAFITVRPPSKFQEVGMQAFGRATGAMFDEILAEQKSATVDNEQTKILDTLFFDLLDGYLIERFRTTKDVSFPKNMRCLETAAHQLENGEGFRLEDLAKGMASCGIEESHAYKIVMDAIDEDLIEIADEEKTDVIAGPFTDLIDPETDEYS